MYKKIKKLFEQKEFDRVLILLDLLSTIGKSGKFEQLSSEGFVNFFIDKHSTRINTVFEYTITNFREPIELETVAGLICMSKYSFCRYFRTSTGRSYFNFLKELRIGYACKLLQESNMSITQVVMNVVMKIYQTSTVNLKSWQKQHLLNTVKILLTKYRLPRLTRS